MRRLTDIADFYERPIAAPRVQSHTTNTRKQDKPSNCGSNASDHKQTQMHPAWGDQENQSTADTEAGRQALVVTTHQANSQKKVIDKSLHTLTATHSPSP